MAGILNYQRAMGLRDARESRPAAFQLPLGPEKSLLRSWFESAEFTLPLVFQSQMTLTARRLIGFRPERGEPLFRAGFDINLNDSFLIGIGSPDIDDGWLFSFSRGHSMPIGFHAISSLKIGLPCRRRLKFS